MLCPRIAGKPFMRRKAARQEDIETLPHELDTLKAKRKQTPHHITTDELPEEARFLQLNTRSKQLVDTIEMIAYHAETAMANRLREYLKRPDQARWLLSSPYTTEADLLPDPDAETLTGSAHIGLDAHTKVHAVGDGAPWIADQTDRVFGAQSNYPIDFYHLCEYLGAASKGCAADHRAWYDTRKRQMKSGQVTAVLAALDPHWEPSEVDDGNAPDRACHRYLRNRPRQFDYPKALHAGLPIGSGKIESAHRHVIQERIKISGAWWTIENAD